MSTLAKFWFGFECITIGPVCGESGPTTSKKVTKTTTSLLRTGQHQESTTHRSTNKHDVQIELTPPRHKTTNYAAGGASLLIDQNRVGNIARGSSLLVNHTLFGVGRG